MAAPKGKTGASEAVVHGRPLVVWYVLDRFPSLTETFIRREIAALTRKGMEIVVVSLNPGDKCTDESGVTAPLYTLRRGGPLRISQTLLRALAKHPRIVGRRLVSLLGDFALSPRLAFHRFKGIINAEAAVESIPSRPYHVHAHFAYVSVDAASCIADFCGVKWSVSAHARDIFTQTAGVLRRRLAGHDAIFACSAHGRETLSKCGFEAPVLMPHGLDFDGFPLERAQSEDYLISIGRLEEKKGTGLLLDALALLKGEGLELKAVIVGDGPERGMLERRVSELNLGKVEFKGSLSFVETYSLLRAARMLVHCSVIARDGDRDGIPNVLLEAMAADVPVAAAATGGIPEVVSDKLNGLLVQTGSAEHIARAVRTLAEDKNLADSLAANASRTVREAFDISRNINTLRDYFLSRCPSITCRAPKETR